MGALQAKQTNADRKYVGRTEPPRDMEIVAAEGSRVRDARGRTFIDFQMGWCVGNLGWNPPEILSRVQALQGPGYVAPNASYAPWTELARAAHSRSRRASWRARIAASVAVKPSSSRCRSR